MRVLIYLLACVTALSAQADVTWYEFNGDEGIIYNQNDSRPQQPSPAPRLFVYDQCSALSVDGPGYVRWTIYGQVGGHIYAIAYMDLAYGVMRPLFDYYAQLKRDCYCPNSRLF